MKVYSLSVTLGKFQFETKIDSRVIIVDDDSGKGKTVLFDIVNSYPGNRAKIISELPVIAGDRVHDFIDAEKSIVIIDEDCKCLQSPELDKTISVINNSDNIFILLTREIKLARLAYGVDNIYKLERKNNVMSLVRKYDYFYKKNSLKQIGKILVEDSTTGFTFFDKFDVDCVSFGGKDKIEKNIPVCNAGNELVVFDRVGFGSCIKAFMQVCSKDVQILDYDSFEGLILEAIGEAYIVGNDVNEETFLTKMVHDKLPQYGKSGNCDCLINCKQCATCLHHNELLNSRAVLNRTKFKDYVRL